MELSVEGKHQATETQLNQAQTNHARMCFDSTFTAGYDVWRDSATRQHSVAEHAPVTKNTTCTLSSNARSLNNELSYILYINHLHTKRNYWKMQDQLEILLLVAEHLVAQSIAYMVSGSMAMNQYAQPRMTRDIDIVIQVSLQDVSKLVNVFSNEFYIDDEAVADAIAREGMFNIIHTESVTKIDFIVRKSTPFRELEFSRRTLTRIANQSVSLVSAEDLLLSKLVWAKDSRSELQLKDAQNLIDAKTDLDWTYLRRWAEDLDVTRMLNALTGVPQ